MTLTQAMTYLVNGHRVRPTDMKGYFAVMPGVRVPSLNFRNGELCPDSVRAALLCAEYRQGELTAQAIDFDHDAVQAWETWELVPLEPMTSSAPASS